jgi:hypothetical protein
MNIRPLILAGVVAAAALTACGPPTPPKLPPQCGPYSAVHEGRPLPCIPGPGDRIDIIMAGPVTPTSTKAVITAATVRCNNLGGAPYWSDAVMIPQRVLTCRTAR